MPPGGFSFLPPAALRSRQPAAPLPSAPAMPRPGRPPQRRARRGQRGGGDGARDPAAGTGTAMGTGAGGREQRGPGGPAPDQAGVRQRRAPRPAPGSWEGVWGAAGSRGQGGGAQRDPVPIPAWSPPPTELRREPCVGYLLPSPAPVPRTPASIAVSLGRGVLLTESPCAGRQRQPLSVPPGLGKCPRSPGGPTEGCLPCKKHPVL